MNTPQNDTACLLVSTSDSLPTSRVTTSPQAGTIPFSSYAETERGQFFQQQRDDLAADREVYRSAGLRY